MITPVVFFWVVCAFLETIDTFSPTRKFSGHTPADKKAAAAGGAPSSAAKSAPGSSSPASTKAPAATPAPKGKDDAKK